MSCGPPVTRKEEEKQNNRRKRKKNYMLKKKTLKNRLVVSFNSLRLPLEYKLYLQICNTIV